VLAVFGGGVVHVGVDAGAANTMDMATLSYVYGAVLGFIHGARVCEAEGIPIDAYGRVVAAMSPSYGEFLKHEAAVIQSGDYSVTESPLSISVEATARLERIARESGLDARVPALAAQLFREAGDAGLGEQELAALIKVLR
jgi:3-hydroxyisobutyrate dehydrogenase-like beta-hydroxyacid dehydrogenase